MFTVYMKNWESQEHENSDYPKIPASVGFIALHTVLEASIQYFSTKKTQ